uniref:Adenosine 3'-phospho 5'-phosphosulfate transporter 1 n=1 Tax=Romanomermis culicivorax TaxID=13658 RepID=A0A915JY24_ROMCU
MNENLTETWWFVGLLKNLFCYLLCVFLFIGSVRLSKFYSLFLNAEKSRRNRIYKFLNRFIWGSTTRFGSQNLSQIPYFVKIYDSKNQDFLSKKLNKCALFLFCAGGLLTTYLAWGILQERLMTSRYEFSIFNSTGNEYFTQKRKFKDSQFVVFSNRLGAFLISAIYLTAFRRRKNDFSSNEEDNVPLHKYFYASFSNILSSYCQYEALKFISFPAQVLGKASKIVPTMLMGIIVQRKSYPCCQYFSGLLISAGVFSFLLYGYGGDDESVHSTMTKNPKIYIESHQQNFHLISGLILMSCYLASDSFTSNWQNAMFSKYRQCSSMQMMLWVNFYSILLTLVGLTGRGDLFSTSLDILSNGSLAYDIFLTSICSSIGQLFIFYTIYKFGAVNFTIIMTTRQALSILLSCWIFGHKVNLYGYTSLAVVFWSLFVYNYSKRSKKL